MEGFFGILKRKMFCGFEMNFKNLSVLETAIRRHINYYNTKSIKSKLKGLTPIEFRALVHSLNLLNCPNFWFALVPANLLSVFAFKIYNKN